MPWNHLARGLPTAIPAALLRSLPSSQWLTRSRCYHERSLCRDGFYPCRNPREATCVKRLVWQPAPVAYCGRMSQPCAPEPLTEDDLVEFVFDEESLSPMLQRSLRLDPLPVSPGPLVTLGQRRLGEQLVRFLLTGDPCSPLTRDWLAVALQREPELVLAVLYPHPRQLAAHTLEHPRICWLALADALQLDDRLAFDLTGLWKTWAGGASPGVDLWPRYTFAADPQRGRFWYAGQRLDLDHNERARDLLCALLRGSGDWQSPHELVPRVFSDQITPRTSSRRRSELSERVRNVKSALSKALVSLRVPSPVAPDPIETLQGRGYRIDVPPERILWMSEA